MPLHRPLSLPNVLGKLLHISQSQHKHILLQEVFHIFTITTKDGGPL